MAAIFSATVIAAVFCGITLLYAIYGSKATTVLASQCYNKIQLEVYKHFLQQMMNISITGNKYTAEMYFVP